MAGLGYAQHRSSGLQDDFRDFDPEDAFEVSHNRRDDARPRIGTGARLRPPRRKAADGLLLWRALATSASVLILGMGGLVAYHAIGSGIPASSTSASPQPAPAQQPPALKTVERGHAQMATKVASILGAPSSSAPAVPPQSAGTVQMAAASPAPAEPAPA
ncbi:hypothetical protein K9U40_22330, partial [Xanthobacter autotrophicus]|nr:hypothetical protein [Xanthobacter autotrophicus]